MTTETIRSDFDRLAILENESGGWSHYDHYHAHLLRHVPASCDESLEIGCGTGAFARLLAGRSRYTLGMDLSPEMIRIARMRSAGFANLDYQVADRLEWPVPPEQFDCIASIATMHHLPLDPMLYRMKTALKKGGVLLVLDLFKANNLTDLFLNAIAFPVNLVTHLARNQRIRPPYAQRLAWADHGRHDHYLKVLAVRRICRDILPGAIIRKHLFWSFSLIWCKPVV